MRYLILLYFIKLTSCFVPNVLLNGPIGEKIKSYSVSRSVSYKCIKKYEIQEIIKDSPTDICKELSNARELLRDPFRTHDNVSFFMTHDNKEHLFTVIYRKSESLPTIYTIESVVRTPGVDFKSNDIYTILEQMCNDRRGFLQIQGLKRWSNGRYNKESYLEKKLYLNN